MKAAYFLLLTIGCAIPMPHIAYAQSSQQRSGAGAISNNSSSPSDNENNNSGEQRDANRPSHCNLACNHADRNQSKHLIPVPHNRLSFRPATVRGLAPLGSSRPGKSEKKGPIREGTAQSALPNGTGPGPATTGNVPHRSPNPAIIGGTLKTSNTGVVNGTRMQHKH